MVPRPARPATSAIAPTTMSGFQRPVRVTTWPPIVEVSIWLMISGIVIRPARVAECPPASWKYWVRKVLLPNIATPTARLAMIMRMVVRLPSRRIGTIGSLARSSVTHGEGDGDGEAGEEAARTARRSRRSRSRRR